MHITKKHDDRKNEILDAAEILFNTKGYNKTTIIDLLTEVGIAKGTFYYYFTSKEEVLDAIVMRYMDTLTEAAKSIAADPSLRASEKLFKVLTAENSEFAKKEKIIEHLHQVNNAEMHQKSLVETVYSLTPILTDVIEQGIHEGTFNTQYPKEVVEFLLTSSQFMMDPAIFNWTQEELIEKMTAFEYIVEKLLGVEKGSLNYISQICETMRLPEKEGEME